MYQEGLWAAQRWVHDAPKVFPRGSKKAPRRTKTAFERLTKVSRTLTASFRPFPETSKRGPSLDTSLTNQYPHTAVPKHTCVTSCKCLFEIMLEALGTPSGVFKHFWDSVQRKHTMATSCRCAEALWTASNASWSHAERLMKASWTLQNRIPAGQQASQKTKTIFPMVQQSHFTDVSHGELFWRMYCTSSIFDVFQRRNLQDFFDTCSDSFGASSKTDIWKSAIAKTHRWDIL